MLSAHSYLEGALSRVALYSVNRAISLLLSPIGAGERADATSPLPIQLYGNDIER